MKGCDEYRIAIQLYVDAELNGEDLEEFSTHLQGCAECREEVEAELELSRLLRHAKPLFHAPDALRKRIMKATDGPPGSH